MKKVVLLAALGLVASAGASFAGDAANGEKLFAKCKICHAVPGPDAATKPTGPNITGVVGRKMAGDEKYEKYGDDLKAMGAAGKTWDEAQLATYLANPKAFNPGTKMAFAGFGEDKAAAEDVVAFLASKK